MLLLDLTRVRAREIKKVTKCILNDLNAVGM
jgi:hypothetical protein